MLEDRAGFRKDGVIVLTDKERGESKRNRNDNERADDCRNGGCTDSCLRVSNIWKLTFNKLPPRLDKRRCLVFPFTPHLSISLRVALWNEDGVPVGLH